MLLPQSCYLLMILNAIRTLTILMTVWLYKMTCLICIHGVASGSLISMKVYKCAVVRFPPRSTASLPNQIYLINCHPVTPLKCMIFLGNSIMSFYHPKPTKYLVFFAEHSLVIVLFMLRKSYTFHLLNVNSLIVHLFGAQCF